MYKIIRKLLLSVCVHFLSNLQLEVTRAKVS